MSARTVNGDWDDIIRESEAAVKAAAMTDSVYAKARDTMAQAYKMSVELLDQRRNEKLTEKLEADNRDRAFKDAIKDGAATPVVTQEAIDANLKTQVQNLNKKFFVVEEYGGKCIVAWQQ